MYAEGAKIAEDAEGEMWKKKERGWPDGGVFGSFGIGGIARENPKEHGNAPSGHPAGV